MSQNEAIQTLINYIDAHIGTPELLNKVINPHLLIEGLEELKAMIEMYDIKQMIVDQLKFLLVGRKFEGLMLHSVITGNPGTGKTKCARILAKIWTSLEMIKPKKRVDYKSMY